MIFKATATLLFSLSPLFSEAQISDSCVNPNTNTSSFEGEAQTKQDKNKNLHIIPNIFEETLKQQDTMDYADNKKTADDLYHMRGAAQKYCYHLDDADPDDSSCLFLGEAYLTPELLDSMKERMGIFHHGSLPSPAFHRGPTGGDKRWKEDKEKNDMNDFTEVGVLTDTRVMYETTLSHHDHYIGTGQRVTDENDVAFIMMNTNPDAFFQHGETSVPIVEGSLVHFNGRISHNTVINSGRVDLLGPFEMRASWLSGNIATKNTVGCERARCVPASGGGGKHNKHMKAILCCVVDIIRF